MTITDIQRPLAPDETGGLELFIDMLDLRTKRDATAEHRSITPKLTEPDDEQDSDAPGTAGTPAQPVLQPAVRKSESLLRRTLGRVKASISRAVQTVKEGLAWLASDIPNPQLLTRFRNRFFGYKGTHHVRTAWYGRQRSTSAAVVITRERHARAQQTSRTKEGVLSSYYVLPEYWVSHMTSFIEVIRGHEDMLRGRGEHFVCQ